MAKKVDYAKEREKMIAMLDIDENLYPEMEPVADWLDVFTEKMKKACAEAMSEFPEGQGGACEAFMIGLARFNCQVLERFQCEGFVSEGHDAYGIFHDVLMPTAHEMVKREVEEQQAQGEEEPNEQWVAIAKDIMNADMSIDDILAKHFRDDMTDDERQMVREKLERLRKMHTEGKGN